MSPARRMKRSMSRHPWKRTSPSTRSWKFQATIRVRQCSRPSRRVAQAVLPLVGMHPEVVDRAREDAVGDAVAEDLPVAPGQGGRADRRRGGRGIDGNGRAGRKAEARRSGIALQARVFAVTLSHHTTRRLLDLRRLIATIEHMSPRRPRDDRAPSQVDVAQLAGVSTQTVSRVMSGRTTCAPTPPGV